MRSECVVVEHNYCPFGKTAYQLAFAVALPDGSLSIRLCEGGREWERLEPDTWRSAHGYGASGLEFYALLPSQQVKELEPV